MTHSIEQIEKLESKRTRLIKVNLAGFILWDGMRIVNAYLLTNPAPVLKFIEILGWALWFVSLFMILSLRRKINSSRQMSAILNDELILSNRLKAWRFAFGSVMVMNGCLIAINLFWPVSGIFAAESSIFAGVVATIGSFLYYSESNE